MTAIFDYGAGNLRSVQNTLGAIGASYELVNDAEGLRRATKIILPGVWHFGQIMRALDDLKVRETLVERIRTGVLYGRSNHHKIEAIFKCFARAMRYACSTGERLKEQLPSTKGLL